MEQNKFPVKLFSAAAVIAALVISACNNNDTNPAPSATDTSATNSMTTPPVTDSGMAQTATDTSMMKTTTATTGVAKPNPSKKGMKGKVTVVTTTTTTAKADAAPDASGVYRNVDHIPAFPGGNAGLQKYFDDNIQYPADAVDNGVEGTVKVAFTVDENGKLMNAGIDGDPQGYGLDAEALRVVSNMPKWTPGSVGGKPVKTKFVLPVRFALN